MIQSLHIFTNKILSRKIPFDDKKWKAGLEFYVNHLLTLQICKPKRRPYVSKELIRKISIKLRTLLFLSFREHQKISFSRTCIFANQTKGFISLTLTFADLAKTCIWRPVKFCENCKNMRNLWWLLRCWKYVNIWLMPSKIFEIVTKEFYSV